MLHIKIIKQVPNDQMHEKQTQQRLKLGWMMLFGRIGLPTKHP